MRYRVFTYPVPCEEELAELNGFLSSHRILKVREEFVQQGSATCLVFVVEYLDSVPGRSSGGGREPKVDYKKELSEEEFMVYSRLRDVRRELAEKEATPVYNVFTNAQLAEIVKKRVRTLSALEEIDGVGKGRVEKYGAAVLSVCSEFLKGDAGETGGTSV